jgi:hypothetical protein
MVLSPHHQRCLPVLHHRRLSFCSAYSPGPARRLVASTSLLRFAQVDTEQDRLLDSNADQNAWKNVTFDTPALSGHFECSVIADEGQRVTERASRMHLNGIY